MPQKQTTIAQLLDKVLKSQGDVLNRVPEERRKQAYGRAATVVIDGPNGGQFDLWFTEEGIAPKPKDVETKNRVWMTEDTFWDCITPDISKIERRTPDGTVRATGMQVLAEALEKDRREGSEYVTKYLLPKLMPRLDFRYAMSKQLIVVEGEMSAYDSEEWAQAIEGLVLGKIFPIMARAMVQVG